MNIWNKLTYLAKIRALLRILKQNRLNSYDDVYYLYYKIYSNNYYKKVYQLCVEYFILSNYLFKLSPIKSILFIFIP